MIKLPRRVKPQYLEEFLDWFRLWHAVHRIEEGDDLFGGFTDQDDQQAALEIYKRLNPQKTEPYDPEEVQGFYDE